MSIAKGPCGRCGRTPASGYASAWSEATGEIWFCHGDDDDSPTCYERSEWESRDPDWMG